MLQEALTSPYVDYKYYKDTFKGNKIPEGSFLGHELFAETVLHQITFNRVKRLPEIPAEVKNAICAMAEVNYQEEKKTPGVRSENVEGFSVSYGDFGNTTGISGKKTEMYNTAKIYLDNTGLLFKGRSRKYDFEC